MKTNYIAYDCKTFKIVKVSEFFNKSFNDCVNLNNVHWINITHPKTKDILTKINQANGTDL